MVGCFAFADGLRKLGGELVFVGLGDGAPEGFEGFVEEGDEDVFVGLGGELLVKQFGGVWLGGRVGDGEEELVIVGGEDAEIILRLGFFWDWEAGDGCDFSPGDEGLSLAILVDSSKTL